MSKRLRKRIRELCGLERLERTGRRKLAQNILNSLEFKQRLCNKVPGLSFRDIDRTMNNILNENQPTASEKEENELRHLAPQKFSPDAILKEPDLKNKNIKYKTLTREETRKLLEIDSIPIKREISPPVKEYKTWTREDVRALIAGNYGSTDSKYKKHRNEG